MIRVILKNAHKLGAGESPNESTVEFVQLRSGEARRPEDVVQLAPGETADIEVAKGVQFVVRKVKS